jgi:hypothetical protein
MTKQDDLEAQAANEETGYGATEEPSPGSPPQVLPDPPFQPDQPGQPPQIDPEPPDPQEPWSDPQPPEPPTPWPPELPPDPAEREI